MPFISIKEETYDSLKRLKQEKESDEDLIQRLVEYARCYMIIKGAITNEECRGFYFEGATVWLTFTELQGRLSGVPTKHLLTVWENGAREE